MKEIVFTKFQIKILMYSTKHKQYLTYQEDDYTFPSRETEVRFTLTYMFVHSGI